MTATLSLNFNINVVGIVLTSPPPPGSVGMGQRYTHVFVAQPAGTVLPFTWSAPTLPSWLTLTPNADGSQAVLDGIAPNAAGAQQVVINVSGNTP